MRRHHSALLGALAVLAAALTAPAAHAAPAHVAGHHHGPGRHHGHRPPRAVGAQTLAVPAYFNPSTPQGQANWNTLDQTAPEGTIAIMDTSDSGPGSSPDPNWVSTVATAQSNGIRILCYIETKNGDGSLRPIADVEADIPHCLQWYHPDGIFFDETGSTADGSLDRLSEVATLYHRTKQQKPDAIIALNPGQGVSEKFAAYSDIICLFEGPWSGGNYNYQTWTPDSWVTQGVASGKYAPGRFWNLVYSTRTPADMKAAVSRSKGLGIGDVYVTDEEPGPQGWLGWGHLPAYWSSEIPAVVHP